MTVTQQAENMRYSRQSGMAAWSSRCDDNGEAAKDKYYSGPQTRREGGGDTDQQSGRALYRSKQHDMVEIAQL